MVARLILVNLRRVQSAHHSSYAGTVETERNVPLSVVTREDFEAMRIAVNVAMSEAAERQMDLSVADITVRLLDAYLMNERDPKKLAEAIVFNTENSYLN